MAKEVIPPDPIPVGENDNFNTENYCASFMDYSDESYSDTSKNLLQYLESEYFNSGLGGSTRSFIAYDTTRLDVWNKLSSEFSGTISDLDKRVFLSESGDDVLITTMLY